MPHCSGCGNQLAAEATQCPACGKLVPSETPAKASKAVWIVVGAGCLLVGLAVAGIVAAVFIPNFLDALQKAKSKRTVADVRLIGTAVESYRVDHDGDVPAVRSIDELAAVLEPEYLVTVPRTDGWKQPFVYVCWSPEADPERCDSYRLASGGRDGELEQDLGDYEEGSFATTDYDADIVYGDGAFVRWPEAHPTQ